MLRKTVVNQKGNDFFSMSKQKEISSEYPILVIFLEAIIKPNRKNTKYDIIKTIFKPNKPYPNDKENIPSETATIRSITFTIASYSRFSYA